MKILYIDMDNVLVDFKSGIDRLTEQEKLEYEGDLDDVPKIFSKMDPMPGAIEAYKELSSLFDTYILTTSPWNNRSALVDKMDWVKKHLGDLAYKRIIFSHHKNLNSGDFLIDDRLKNGAEKFSGEHIHFGEDKRFLEWSSVLAYLREKT